MKPLPVAIFALLLQIGKVQGPPPPMFMFGSYLNGGCCNNATNYFDFFDDNVKSTTITLLTQMPIPRNGTIGNFYFAFSGPTGGALNSCTVALNVNGTDTPLTITDPPSTPANKASDLVHTFAVRQGDLITLKQTGSNGVCPAMAGFSFILQ